MKQIKFRLSAAVFAACLGTALLAHGGVKNAAVMARMDAMKSIGDAMKTLGTMNKGAIAFDVETARNAAKTVALYAAKTTLLFKDQETDPKSEALPAIWDRFDDFSAKARDMETVATDLSQILSTPEDLDNGMIQLGATCKACHKEYRK